MVALCRRARRRRLALHVVAAAALLFYSCGKNQSEANREIGRLPAESIPLGSHTYPIATRSPEAQRAFDRGLTLAYGFAHEAAEKEFRRAAGFDPQCAMAWWGVALVNGPHINFPMVPPNRAKTAWEALSKARSLASGSSARERALIEALGRRYAENQPEDRSSSDVAYAAAMREVWQAYPQDADIATLFAEADDGPAALGPLVCRRQAQSRNRRNHRHDRPGPATPA